VALRQQVQQSIGRPLGVITIITSPSQLGERADQLIHDRGVFRVQPALEPAPAIQRPRPLDPRPLEPTPCVCASEITAAYPYDKPRERSRLAVSLNRGNCPRLGGANLTGARLEGADLRFVEGLTVDEVVAARPDPTTRLPATIAADPAVAARIAQVEAKAAAVRETRRQQRAGRPAQPE
jgi:hypothetical protein